jgi:outer membrane protein TolC
MSRGPSRRLIALVALVVLVPAVGAAESPDSVRADWERIYLEQDRAGAEAGGAGPETLQELQRIAETNNAGLRAAFDRWTAAREQVSQAGSLPDPRISYAYFLESVETRVGPQKQKFGIAQSIPLFGKLGLREDVAVQMAHAAGAAFEQARQQLRFRVSQLWNDTYYLHRAIEVTGENVRLLGDLESVALAQYASGMAPQAAVIRAQVERGRLEDRLRTLRDQQRPLLAALNAELNRAPDTPIARPTEITTRPLPETLDPSLVEASPQLAAQRSLVGKEAAAARLAGRGPIPDLTIGAEYIDTGESPMPNIADTGKDAVVASASVNIPLWFGRYRAEKHQADARHAAADRDLTQLRSRLLAEMELAHFEYRDADRRVDLYEHTLVPKARQSLRVAEDAFTTGQNTFLELVDAQRTLLEFQLSLERARADRATKYAHIRMIVGHDPVTNGSGGTP